MVNDFCYKPKILQHAFIKCKQIFSNSDEKPRKVEIHIHTKEIVKNVLSEEKNALKKILKT